METKKCDTQDEAHSLMPIHSFEMLPESSHMFLYSISAIAAPSTEQANSFFSHQHAMLLSLSNPSLTMENCKLFSINHYDFIEFYDYPGIISERFHRMMDPEEKGIVCLSNYQIAMTKFCFGTLKEKIELVFQMLDFDNDGMISKLDIKTIMMHIPIDHSSEEEKFFQLETPTIGKTISTTKAISKLLNHCFKSDFISYKQFENCTLTKAADVFICLLYLIQLKFPTITEINMVRDDLLPFQPLSDITYDKHELPITNIIVQLQPIANIIKCSLNSKCKRCEENISSTSNDKVNLVKSIALNANDISIKNSSPQKKRFYKLHSRSLQNIHEDIKVTTKQEVCSRNNTIFESSESNTDNISDLFKAPTNLSFIITEKGSIQEMVHERRGIEISKSYFILRNKTIYSISLIQK